ncbi:hypothetical protein DFA_01908 [Cavenderia fasciculata]|uniref:RING zinc finger-containing protein n=1 Tax=Cavenderia fasciculata TaxID=261658 RepID=F4PQR1_CACFS|nr:uncharacterized protein DFA_01908 [Cavenderia fasciculata]EGG22019.1 hypothetical protein DFA_01908 [Cavenderia fasciculata]|eukprot:XP_004359870.1 hypothetical protein DFA_01908 [Cavenderia fasciculata]
MTHFKKTSSENSNHNIRISQAMSNDRETLSIEQRVASQSDLDALTCSICLSLMTAPIKQCVSGHLGCGSCLDKVAETTGKCPQCRVPISNGGLSRSLLADNMLSSLKIHCENYFQYNQESKKWVKDARGCQEITTVATSNDHKLICKYTLYRCQHKGCDAEVLKDDMTSHLAQCKYQQQQQQQSQEKISCPFGNDICKFIGTKKEVDKHILNELSKHIETFSNVNKKKEDARMQANNQRVDNEIKSLKDELKECQQSIKELKKGVVEFEWIIPNYLSIYNKSSIVESDQFNMGGFTWYIATFTKDNDWIVFYLHVCDANQKIIKVDFTLDLNFPGMPVADGASSTHEISDKRGYGFTVSSYRVNNMLQTDSISIVFKGYVVSVKSDTSHQRKKYINMFNMLVSMTAPVKQCVSGHLGCQSCLDRVAETTGTCPQCRTPISNGRLSRSLITDHILSSLRVYSKDSKEWVKDARGCQEIVTVETSDNHKLTCKYNLVKCQHKGCDVELLKDDMTSHLAQCRYQSKAQEKISCPFGTDICKFTGTKTEIDQHILNQLSDHLQINNQRVDDKINSLQLQFTKSIESIKEHYNQQTNSLWQTRIMMESQMQSLQQKLESQFQSKLDKYKNSIMESNEEYVDEMIWDSEEKTMELNREYVDKKFKKCKEKTKDMVKHMPVHFEWNIPDFLEKYDNCSDEFSDYFKMGGFYWYIASYLDDKDDGGSRIGFYVFLVDDRDHGEAKSWVKVHFTLEVEFSGSLSHCAQFTKIYKLGESNGTGFTIDSDTYLNGMDHNELVTVTFKGYVASFD